MDIVVALLSFLGGGAVASFITQLFGRRRTNAEADVAAVEAAARVVELYDKALKDLQRKVEALEEQVRYLRNELETRDREIATLRAALGSER